MLGMSIQAFISLHIALGPIGIALGFIVVAGMFGSNRLDRGTTLLHATHELTSVTGCFRHYGLNPSYVHTEAKELMP
jgi:hypothetical protein